MSLLNNRRTTRSPGVTSLVKIYEKAEENTVIIYIPSAIFPFSPLAQTLCVTSPKVSKVLEIESRTVGQIPQARDKEEEDKVHYRLSLSFFLSWRMSR